MIRHILLLLIATACLVGCGNTDRTGAANAMAAPAAEPPLLISPEDLLTVESNALASGPSITGSVQPERRADLRAEVSAVVLEVLKENGDAVRRGDLLVRLDDTAIRDSLTSAESTARAAAQAYEQAERQFQRLLKLRETGVVSAQEAEDVEIRRNNAQSDLAAAQTRVVVARQQLQRTEVRAPFDGVVSDRKVSSGDTAQIGKELLKIIDPRSMRFEGRISADSAGSVRVGQRVLFRIHGYPDKAFVGRIARVNPAANETTRQVELLVNFEERGRSPTVAGLYAEGRVETRSTLALTLPPTAVVNDGNAAFAWRVRDSALQKVKLALGHRDARTGEFVLISGLSAGDRLLRYPSFTLREGRRVELDTKAVPEIAENVPAAGSVRD